MKDILKKISSVMKKIFGWGMLASVAVGALMFLGYVVALIIGGETAAQICYFLYKQLTPVLIYATSVLMIFGVLAMYLGGEVALSGKKKEAAPKTDAPVADGEKPEADGEKAETSSTEPPADK